MVSPSWRDVPAPATPRSERANKQRGAWNYEWAARHVTGRRLKGEERGRGWSPPGSRRQRGRVLRRVRINPRRDRYCQLRAPGPPQNLPSDREVCPCPPPPPPKSHKEHFKLTVKFLNVKKKNNLHCCTYTHYLHYKIPEKYLLYQLCSADFSFPFGAASFG